MTPVRTFTTTQRLEVVPPGRLAWLYLRPHETTWAAALELATDAGYEPLADPQTVIDGECGPCVRYVCVMSQAAPR